MDRFHWQSVDDAKGASPDEPMEVICTNCDGGGMETMTATHPQQNVYGWTWVDGDTFRRVCARCNGVGFVVRGGTSVPVSDRKHEGDL